LANNQKLYSKLYGDSVSGLLTKTENQIQDQNQNKLQKNQLSNQIQNQNLNFKQIAGINPENIRTVISKSSNSLLNQNILSKTANRPFKGNYVPKRFFSKQLNSKYFSKGL
jgi:hypothetical protein